MYVDLGDARLFFDTVGAQFAPEPDRMVARPTLIVLHAGPGFDHSTMRPFFDRFADTHHVLYLDHRCNGRSTGDLATCRIDQCADDIVALCDRLGITRPVVLGHSFGGMVAMAYAARHPDHPARIIVCAGAARLRLEETYALMEARGGAEARTVAQRFWETSDAAAIEDYLRVCMPFYNPGEMADANAQMLARAIVRPEVGAHFILGEMRTMDRRADCARITCPMLLLAGDYDPITPVICAEDIRDCATNAPVQLEIVARAGHSIHIDRPDALDAAVRRFLG